MVYFIKVVLAMGFIWILVMGIAALFAGDAGSPVENEELKRFDPSKKEKP